MRVRRESAATGYAVVIHYTQGAKLHAFRIVIICERKSEAGIQPPVIGMTAGVALANVDHHGLQNCMHNTRYNDYCQEAYLILLPLPNFFLFFYPQHADSPHPSCRFVLPSFGVQWTIVRFHRWIL